MTRRRLRAWTAHRWLADTHAPSIGTLCRLVVLTAWATGCSSAPDATGPVAVDTATQATGELLLAQPPVGWTLAGGTTSTLIRTAQYVPPGESSDDWTRRITFEALKEQPLPDPLEFLEVITAEQAARCTDFESYPTFAGFENGFETAVHLLLCGRERDSDMAVATMVKTIRGREFFYVITRARRGTAGTTPADEQAVAAWSLYLKSVTVCDTRLPDQSCPG